MAPSVARILIAFEIYIEIGSESMYVANLQIEARSIRLSLPCIYRLCKEFTVAKIYKIVDDRIVSPAIREIERR